MEEKLTIEECSTLKHVCEIVLQMNPQGNHHEAVIALKESLSGQEEVLLDAQQKKTAKWCMTLPQLYCQKKMDVLERSYGKVICPMDPSDITWFSELQKKILLHKLHAVNLQPSRKLYISDLHFYHNSLNRQMDCRGFKNYEEMNAYMIQKWNEKVTVKDEVYILGDLSIAKGIATNEIVKQLNGRLYYIAGNHDAFLSDPLFDRNRFQWIKPYAEIHDNNRTVILSHYPIFCYNGQYHRREGIPSVYMLYGHVHNTQDEALVNRFIQETRKTVIKSKYDKEPVAIPCVKGA